MKSLSNHLTKKEIAAFPIQKFEGEIVLIEQRSQLKSAITELSNEKVVGFDTEAKPSFRKGEYNPVCLVQLATRNKAFLFRIDKTEFSDELVEFFENEKILKVGVAIRDDLVDLNKIRKFDPAAFVEISEVTADMGIVNAGVKGLAAIFLGFRVSKAQQTSDWSAKKLTQFQMDYAATDAWVCLEIYHRILELEMS